MSRQLRLGVVNQVGRSVSMVTLGATKKPKKLLRLQFRVKHAEKSSVILAAIRTLTTHVSEIRM